MSLSTEAPTVSTEASAAPAKATRGGIVPFRLTVGQFLKMIDAGVFSGGGPTSVYEASERRTAMATIRVPYPTDPERRRDLFERMVAMLGRFGTYEGSPDAGSFRGSTPVGEFAGSYRSAAGSDVLEIELTRKPWLVPASLIESEVRKRMAQIT